MKQIVISFHIAIEKIYRTIADITTNSNSSQRPKKV